MLDERFAVIAPKAEPTGEPLSDVGFIQDTDWLCGEWNALE